MSKGTHINCPHCKKFIEYNAKTCKHCGSEILFEENNTYSENFESITFIKNALKDRYEIFELIGKGGMASVYKAKQINLERIVALKVIHPNLIHDQEFVERFMIEAKISASLQHPNIVNIYDFGQVGNIYFMSIEFIDGSDLSSLVRQNQRIDSEQTVSYLRSIANALAYIHKKGLLHRDIKSSNILITADQRAVLTDFGIAYSVGSKPLTIAGTLLGTPEYLSPEQASGKSAIAESDYYSLGIVLYECITGKLPFTDTNPVVTINKIINNTPTAPQKITPEIPKNIENISLGLLKKDPVKRRPFIDLLMNYGLTHTPSDQIFKHKNKYAKELRKKQTIPKDRTKSQSNKIILLSLLIILFISILSWILIITISNKSQMAIQDAESITPIDISTRIAPVREEPLTVPDAKVDETLSKEPEKVTYEARIAVFIKQIEDNMIEVDDIKIMKTPINTEMWQFISNESDLIRSTHVIRYSRNNLINNVSYNLASQFITKLNQLPGNPYRYEMPSLVELNKAKLHADFQIFSREWVRDYTIGNPQIRKIYHHQYDEGSLLERNRQPEVWSTEIFFRLKRDN